MPKVKKTYNCELCNYETILLSRYKRHLKTNKHETNLNASVPKKGFKNESFYSKNGNLDSQNELFCVPKQFICKFCKKEFTFKKNLKRHMNGCDKVEVVEKEEHIAVQTEQIKELENKIKSMVNLIETLNYEKTELEKENKDILKKVFEKHINEDENKTVNINYFNMNYIIQNFKDVQSIETIIAAPLNADEIEYMRNNPPSSSASYLIKKRFIENFEVHERPVHCVDKPRKKMLVKSDDGWSVDYKGRNIFDKIYPKVSKQYETEMNKNMHVDEKIRLYGEISDMVITNRTTIVNEMMDHCLLKNDIDKNPKIVLLEQ
jgi:hypothetical protein